MKSMTEARVAQKMATEAEQLYGRYRKYMDILEKSTLIKAKGRLTAMDAYALGKQLEMFEAYKQMCEEDGSLNVLGKLPLVAFDVITAVQGASVIPALSSVQPIEEEKGLVYFKNIRAQTTRGNVTAQDILTDPRQQIKTPSGYASGVFSGVVGATGDGTAKTFSFTLTAGLPVRSETMVITLASGGTIKAVDIGGGQLYGSGVSGTVNYATGAVVVNFYVAPANLDNILVAYQQNFEGSSTLPEIQSFFDSKTIQAQVYALKGTIGLLQSYAMKKRFGLVGEEELAKDLVAEINKEVGGDLIRKIGANLVGNTNFDRATPSGVSYFEHKQTFKDKIADAESVLVGNAGRGTINTIVAGKTAAAIIQTLPGFVKLTDGNTLGAHIFGTLDGMTVIRVSETALMPAAECYLLWKGTSPFETCAVYSPFMPLTVTDTLPQSLNPLQRARAAAVFAGVDVVVGAYATKLTILNP